MPREVNVPLDWKYIDWMPDETWKKSVEPNLIAAGVNVAAVPRSVYVIRLNGEYAIDYPEDESPVVYIGEGNFFNRINSHRSWIAGIEELVGEFSFQVCIAYPRVRNQYDAYRDAEAALLERFGEVFGTAPLWNKQFETRLCPHYVYNTKQMDRALRKRSGARYRWAIRPLRSSPFHKAFHCTDYE